MNIYEGLIISCLLLLILGIVADAFDAFDFDLDIGDFEIGDFDVTFLPVSLRALSLGGIVYCSMCLIFGDALVNVVINGVVAYLSACIVATFTKFLKKKESLADNNVNYTNILARVVTPVHKNEHGTVSCNLPNQSIITFVAITDEETELSAGTEVLITSVKDGVATVVAID